MRRATSAACCACSRTSQPTELLIIDELGYVPLRQTGAELLFEVFSQRHERSSTIVTSNLPFDEWTERIRRPRRFHDASFLDRLVCRRRARS